MSETSTSGASVDWPNRREFLSPGARIGVRPRPSHVEHTRDSILLCRIGTPKRLIALRLDMSIQGSGIASR